MVCGLISPNNQVLDDQPTTLSVPFGGVSQHIDVSASEALNHYIKGFKPKTKAWVRIQGVNTLNLAMLLAEFFDSIFL